MNNKQTDIQKKNTRILLSVFALVFIMVGVSFAAVPMYNLFCRVTGFGGTTQQAASLPDTMLEREITILFNADTARNMPWNFKPEERSIKIKLGQKGLTNFIAGNPTSEAVMGTALYNVVPNKAGKYFHKVQCFCFDEQVLPPGERMNMPVMFYVDPALNDDPSMEDVDTITLSYTFFRAESEALDQALEEFYNQQEIEDSVKTNPSDKTGS